jgi:hypothetical protein
VKNYMLVLGIVNNLILMVKIPRLQGSCGSGGLSKFELLNRHPMCSYFLCGKFIYTMCMFVRDSNMDSV